LETTKAEVMPEPETTFELSGNCRCEVYDDETGESKLDEQGNAIPSNECLGCYDDDKLYLQDQVIADWVVANGWELDTPLLVKSGRMTWRGVSGWTTATPKTLIDKLTLNGDFILRFTLSPDHKRLTCVRASHDELGAFFEFEQAPAESEVE
jgi:hypothetical protein